VKTLKIMKLLVDENLLEEYKAILSEKDLK
jgi:hypothetical protein